MFCFCKQKTAYEMRISDWSSDVCSSDLASGFHIGQSEEDRWLMDLLRAHADALLVGVKTLTEEVEMRGYGPRGPVYRIVNPELTELRTRLGRSVERRVGKECGST